MSERDVVERAREYARGLRWMADTYERAGLPPSSPSRYAQENREEADLFDALAAEVERERKRADWLAGELERRRAEVADAARRYGVTEPGRLHSKWTAPQPAGVPYDSGEVITAVCAALTQEGVSAWSGDGTSIVEQMVRAQAQRAERAESEVERLRAGPYTALPTEEAPTDREWTPLEWLRNQLWLANKDAKRLRAERDEARSMAEQVRLLCDHDVAFPWESGGAGQGDGA